MSKHVLLGTLALILVPASASPPGIYPFNSTSIDGQHTSNLPADLQHQPSPAGTPGPNQTGMTGSYAGNPCFIRDYVQTTNNIDLTVHQSTLYATYGISRHFDVSVAVPILDVSLKVTSNATINQNSFTSAGTAFHQFNPSIVPGCTATPCLNATFSSSGAATGIGDVDLPGKYEVYHGEHFGFAAGVDVRLPTGDEQNFLRSGAIGGRPFGGISYGSRISPHAEIG